MKALLLAAVVLAAQPALAVTEIAALGGLEATRAWSTVDDTGSGDIGGAFGFGAMIQHSIADVYSVEYGVFRIPYALRDVTPTGFVQTSQPYLQLPIIFRYHPKPQVSIGAGYYVARTVGVASRLTRVEGQEDVVDETSLPPNSTFDHGVALVAGVKFPVFDTRLRLIGDMRYLFGLKNVGTGDIQQAHYNHLQIVAGLSVEL